MRDTEFYLRGYLVGIMERDEMTQIIKMKLMLQSEVKQAMAKTGDKRNEPHNEPKVVPTPKSADDVHIS